MDTLFLTDSTFRRRRGTVASRGTSDHRPFRWWMGMVRGGRVCIRQFSTAWHAQIFRTWSLGPVCGNAQFWVWQPICHPLDTDHFWFDVFHSRYVQKVLYLKKYIFFARSWYINISLTQRLQVQNRNITRNVKFRVFTYLLKIFFKKFKKLWILLLQTFSSFCTCHDICLNTSK